MTLQDFTKLPLEQIVKVDGVGSDVVLQTPHKGKVIIPLKEVWHPFIFGSTTQTERPALNVVRQIKSVENEAYEFLMDEWLALHKKPSV